MHTHTDAGRTAFIHTHTHTRTHTHFCIEHESSQLCRVTNVQTQDKHRCTNHNCTCRNTHSWTRLVLCILDVTASQAGHMHEVQLWLLYIWITTAYTRWRIRQCQLHKCHCRTECPERPNCHWDRNHIRNLQNDKRHNNASTYMLIW